MSVAIKLENISKQYRLGQVGTGTISHDLNRWWHRVRGKEDPYSQVGQENRRDQAAESEYVWALKDINLEVEQGEVLGIIGANGAGKSTLLKLISRITSPTTGAIKAKGRIASLLEVGTGMHPEMTARENIYLNGSILGMRRHEISRKLDEIIDFAGCQMYLDTPIKRFSSGMRVRLGFAVAAFLDPEILIVDEVLAVGDAEFQRKAIGKMQEVSHGEGRTVLFVSHNMASIEHLCERVCMLHNGTVEFTGDPREAITHYMARTVPAINNSTDSLEKRRAPVRINAVHFAYESGHVIQELHCGQNVEIRLPFSTTEEITDRDVTISFGVRTPLGQPVFNHHNQLNGHQIRSLPERGCFIFSIDRFPLVAGDYMITYSVQLDGKIVDSGSFRGLQVVEGKYYATNNNVPQSHGLVHIDGHWRVQTA